MLDKTGELANTPILTTIDTFDDWPVGDIHVKVVGDMIDTILQYVVIVWLVCDDVEIWYVKDIELVNWL